MGENLIPSLVLLVVFVVLLNVHQVESRRNGRDNKETPVIKVIKTEYGDIFDCIDIYKQPAFDHPALTNHTIQMKPTSQHTIRKNSISSSERTAYIGLPDGGCPEGTVPIRRILEGDMERLSSLSDSGLTFHPRTKTYEYFHFALLESHSNSPLLGAKATINTYNPVCNGDQHSRGAVWVFDGEVIARRNGFSAGWIVFPKLYGDNRTRLYSSWTNNVMQKGCYNTHCPGFVHVHREIPLGLVLNTSTVDGPQYELTIFIHRDQKTGNWWLSLSQNGHDIGYWPPSLFQDLQDSALVVHFGGESYGPPGVPSPSMGSGLFPDAGKGRACAFKNVRLVDQWYVDVPVDTFPVYTYADVPKCYDVGGNRYIDQEWQYSFFFGGRGGLCGQ